PRRHSSRRPRPPCKTWEQLLSHNNRRSRNRFVQPTRSGPRSGFCISKGRIVNFAQFEVLTFDCYGTLIDWETGILSALRPILKRQGIAVSDESLLESYAEAESSAESGVFMPYKEVLQQVVMDLGSKFGFTPSAEEQ